MGGAGAGENVGMGQHDKLKHVLLLIFFSGVAAAQPFGFGLKLGSTLTDTISGNVPNGSHFIVGPYAEVRLPLSLALEVDALYEHGLYDNVTPGGSTWQFPVLAKYKLLKGPVKPYIEGGPAFSHISDLRELPQLNHRSNYGIVLGVGVEVKVLVLRVSPEIRYNGWAFQNISSPAGLYQSNRNQATFTLGIGF